MVVIISSVVIVSCLILVLAVVVIYRRQRRRLRPMAAPCAGDEVDGSSERYLGRDSAVRVGSRHSKIDASVRTPGGYARQLEPSEERYSRQIYTANERRFSSQSDNDDGVSSVSPSQLRPARFGGIQPRYCDTFGRGPNTLLSYREDDAVPTSHVEDDDVQASAGRGGGSGDGCARHLRSHDSDGGYSRYLSPPDVDDASSVNSSLPRPGAFNGISQRYRNVFGVGPGTLLTGGHGFLTSSVAADDVVTSVRGDGGKKAAASRHSDHGGSMLKRLATWRRRRDSGWQAPRDGVETELQDVEPDQRPSEISVIQKDSASAGDRDSDTRQFPPPSLHSAASDK